MPDPQQAPIPAPAHDGLPEHTTPTWEVELLISSVAVFAMLQLPGWLDDRYFDLVPRLDHDWHTILLLGYVYAKCGALILAATFVLHLLLRSHWIALVGLDSIYPAGVRWDRIRIGRIQRDAARERMGTVADAIERADNRATIVFAVGVYLTWQMLKSFALVLLAALLSFAVRYFVPIDSGEFVLGFMSLVLVPLVLAWRIDNRFGDRIAADGLSARVLQRFFGFFHAIGFGRGSAPGMLLMTSHTDPRRVYAIVSAIILAVLACVWLGVPYARDVARIGNYGFLPEMSRDSGRALLRQHYDDQRGDQRLGTAPYVQSQVITDPYLRLTLPIEPDLHRSALRRTCPQAATATGSAQSTQMLACFGALHPLELDGHPIPASYDLGSDPKAQRPALVAMIDVRALSNGRHELLIGAPAQSDGSATTPDRIAFWK